MGKRRPAALSAIQALDKHGYGYARSALAVAAH